METYSFRPDAGFEGTSDSFRNLFTAVITEFSGTFMFLLLAFAATQISNMAGSHSYLEPNLPLLIYISLAFSVSYTVNVWAYYRVSGGMFNPAVTLALGLAGAISFLRSIIVIIFQLAAGIAASGIASVMFPGPLLISTRLGGGASIAQGLFIEMFLTTQLVITVHMLGVIKQRATYLAPLGMGLAMFVAHLAGFYFTGASLNPARSLGPDTIIRQFPGYHWIYWLGPVLGAFLGTGFFWILRAAGYETCNPGQDDDGRRPENERAL